MKFKLVYSEIHEWDWEGRDNDNGILGILSNMQDEQILLTSDSKSDLTLLAKAYYYDNPNRLTYLCDDNNRVHKIFLHKGEADKESKLVDHKCFFYCLMFLLTLNIGFCAAFGISKIGSQALCTYGMASASVLVYVIIVRKNWLNCLEGVVFTTILSTPAWLVASAVVLFK